MTDEAAADAAIAEAQKANGEARILVNCAGIAPSAKVIDRDGRNGRLSERAPTIFTVS